MIWLAAGKWNRHSGLVFTMDRIYLQGYRWTPLVWLGWRRSKRNSSLTPLQRLLACRGPADWELRGDSPDSVTYSCTRHLSRMIEGDGEGVHDTLECIRVDGRDIQAPCCHIVTLPSPAGVVADAIGAAVGYIEEHGLWGWL